MSINNITNRGYVVLAGAGPGDPDLISVKALKHLQRADVVLIDRLVSPVLIEENARIDAEVIYVGKQHSRGIHTPQRDINEMLVYYASKGKLVLRLKGGDASLFSNILDELKILKLHQIPYEIVPGITAAFGAAAYSAIPLTARGHSRGVRFLTLFDLESVSQTKWSDWASTDDTLVFYMSGKKLPTLIDTLQKNHIHSSKSIAVIQQATTPYQKTIVKSFEELADKKLPEFEYVPTLIIIGSVANLHHQFAWYNEQSVFESYFDNHKIHLKNAI